jgi:hypothetical protein
MPQSNDALNGSRVMCSTAGFRVRDALSPGRSAGLGSEVRLARLRSEGTVVCELVWHGLCRFGNAPSNSRAYLDTYAQLGMRL